MFHVILATSVTSVFRVLIPVNPRVEKVLECFNHGFNSAAEVSADTIYLLKAGSSVGWVPV